MIDSGEDDSAEAVGEKLQPIWTFTWINPNPIETGEFMVPAHLTSLAAREFAALHLVLTDLRFSLACLQEADSLGRPDAASLHSRALIFAGIVAYGRCFHSGVREVRLERAIIETPDANLDADIHDYLFALRNKHVAHSVNEFERCEATALVVGRPGGKWRDGGAIGIVAQADIGLSHQQLKRSISHVDALIALLETKFEEQRRSLYDEFRNDFGAGANFSTPPLIRIADRQQVDVRRPKGASI